MHWDQDEEPKASTSLIEEIRLNSAGMQQVHPTFHVSVFSIGPDMAREAITTKNIGLIRANNDNVKNLLEIYSTDSDREVEEKFIHNYYTVVSNSHFIVMVTTLRIILAVMGWKTGAAFCFTVESFIDELATEIRDDLIEIYRSKIKPANMTFDCAKIVIESSGGIKRHIMKFGKAAGDIISRRANNTMVTMIITALTRLYDATSSTWSVISGVATLDGILNGEIPTVDCAKFFQTVISTVRAYGSSPDPAPTPISAPSSAQASSSAPQSMRQPRRMGSDANLDPDVNLGEVAATGIPAQANSPRTCTAAPIRKPPRSSTRQPFQDQDSVNFD